MTLQKRQAHLKEAYAEIESFNMRRAFISTQYYNTKERIKHSGQEKDKAELPRLKKELDQIEKQAPSVYQKLRNIQTKYLVEYEVEILGMNDHVTTEQFIEELYFFTNCYVDTIGDGWDLEDAKTQDLLYEVADFILLHRAAKFTIKNIRRVQ